MREANVVASVVAGFRWQATAGRRRATSAADVGGGGGEVDGGGAEGRRRKTPVVRRSVYMRLLWRAISHHGDRLVNEQLVTIVTTPPLLKWELQLRKVRIQQVS